MFKVGDRVMCIKDSTGETPEVVLKCCTIIRVVDDDEGFNFKTEEYPDYRFHPSELQLIEEN